MRPVTFPQVLITIAGLAAIGLSHFAGTAESALISAAVAMLFWLRNPPAPPSPPVVKALLVGFIAGTFATHVAACAPFTISQKDADAVIQEGAALEHCQVVAGEAPDGGQLGAYYACVKEGGL